MPDQLFFFYSNNILREWIVYALINNASHFIKRLSLPVYPFETRKPGITAYGDNYFAIIAEPPESGKGTNPIFCSEQNCSTALREPLYKSLLKS